MLQSEQSQACCATSSMNAALQWSKKPHSSLTWTQQEHGKLQIIVSLMSGLLGATVGP